MMRILLICLAVAAAIQSPNPAQNAPARPPATEVFLAPLSLSGGKLSLGTPENISNSPGYDNQPFFAPDGGTLFFTSARGDVSSKCGSPQTDVYRLDLRDRQVARVTDTEDCEYSPTVTPDKQHLSVIRVEPDGTQRLWKFTIDGKNPSLVLPEVKPVGYHAWLDEKTLALFVLGPPATLQVATLSGGTADIVARDIGQSIQKMPSGGVSFVQQAGEGAERTLTVMELSMRNAKAVTRALTPAVAGATQAHLAWMPDGTLLMAHKDVLHAWKAGAAGWRAVADFAALRLRNVTRLAISPTGDRIAIVAVASQ